MMVAIEELRSRVTRGEVQSMLVVVEVRGEAIPRVALFGRYGAEPYYGLVAIERARRSLCRLADRHADPPATH